MKLCKSPLILPIGERGGSPEFCYIAVFIMEVVVVVVGFLNFCISILYTIQDIINIRSVSMIL